MIAGDLNNDYRDDGKTGLESLQIGKFCHSFVDNRFDMWTHYCRPNDETNQLDYLLLLPQLASKTEGLEAEIIRKGLLHRIPDVQPERFSRVGYDRPKASDHCGVAAKIEVRR